MTKYACKECVHSRCSKAATFFSYLMEWKQPDSCFYKCARTYQPAHMIDDSVVGLKLVEASMDYCSVARLEGKDCCGPDARFWTPKKKKDLFKMLTKDHDVQS